MNETLRLAILISGSGSTAEAIIKASQKDGVLFQKIKPIVVFSSKSDALGIEKAQRLGIPVEIVPRKNFPFNEEGRNLYGDELERRLKKYNPDYLSQNGWLSITPDNVIFQYENKIFNQHPGPTEFGGKGMHGLAVHAAVLKFKKLTNRVFPTEASIHRVSSVVDSGVVVARQNVDVYDHDTAESLAARVLPVEHALQLLFWKDVYEGYIVELHRQKPLIKSGEEDFLQQAIIYARQKYPKG